VSRPRIGVSGVVRVVEGAPRTGVNAAYAHSITQAGGLPLILSPVIADDIVVDALDPIHGLLLTGGEDVHPMLYGQSPLPKLGQVDRERDAFEIDLFRGALDRRIPVLAICRGIQLVNVALGGSLWQDLPTERQGALRHDQRDGRTTRSHSVAIMAPSRLARALGVIRLEVNSFHHQAIRDLGRGLMITARAEDGLIEAVESAPEAPWLVAVQWHPEEFHGEAGAPDHGLFAEFVREAGRFRAQCA